MERIPTIFILALGLALYDSPGRAQTLDAAKRDYQALCVGCHGEDGSGGGHGPGFLDVRQPRATSQDAVRDLILKGIPGAGMPAVQVSDAQATAIAAYVMRLKQPAVAAAAAGCGAPATLPRAAASSPGRGTAPTAIW